MTASVRPRVCTALFAIIAGATACAPRRTGETAIQPTTLRARFVVEGPPPVPHEERDSRTRTEPNRCVVTGRFEVNAYVRGDGQLEVAIERGWAIITRNNDKQWDDLHLRLEATGQLGAGSTAIVLGATVDSAGPSVTTWQSSEPLRVLVPWERRLSTRRLMFWLSYRAIGFDGTVTRCETMMRSDTLRFAGTDARG
jgi:hypothetical protein